MEADLVADDIRLPNEIGQAAHHLGFEGVLAPSATGHGVVLAIFLDSRATDSIVEVLELAEGHVTRPTEPR